MLNTQPSRNKIQSLQFSVTKIQDNSSVFGRKPALAFSVGNVPVSVVVFQPKWHSG